MKLSIKMNHDAFMKKKKTYVLLVSQAFPKHHRRAGDSTGFVNLIAIKTKIHTLRGNYELWKKRFEKIAAGEAILSVRSWSGIPYDSNQITHFELTKDDGIGIEKLENPSNFAYATIGTKEIDWGLIAQNDGLCFSDFCDWFKVRSDKPMAIIHFTKFRYDS